MRSVVGNIAQYLEFHYLLLVRTGSVSTIVVTAVTHGRQVDRVGWLYFSYTRMERRRGSSGGSSVHEVFASLGR